jgi:PAS domain S-box-containing protein
MQEFIMGERIQIIAQLHTELTRLRQRVAELESAAAEVVMQRATLNELQDTLEEQGLVEAELRQELAERETTQQAVAAERAQYQTLFELAPDGYLVTNAASIIRQANHAAAHLLGRPLEQLVDLPLAGFVAPESVQHFSTLLRTLHTAPQGGPWEVRFRPPHGKPFVGELTFTVRQGPPSRDMQCHWLLRDVTARKEAEAALNAANAERQRLEREAQRAEHFALLGRLAAGLSHEIRNPLGAITLHTDLLEEEWYDPSPDHQEMIAQSLAEIKTNLARLDDLIQDYLTLVRVTTIEQTPQDLGQVVQTWAAEIHGQATACGVSIRLEGLKELSGKAAIHTGSLRRAFLNLMQNALDAMPAGGTLTLIGQRTDTLMQIQVRDTGSGIPADKLPRIFEPLYTSKPGGTGLGLYIVQEITMAHGGQVTVESREGHGTVFTLTLPVATDDTPQS